MRIAVFASGGGSNFQAILDAIDSGSLKARVVVLICNRSSAGAVERAERHNVPVVILNPSNMDDDAVARETLSVLNAHDADFVALAGYLKKMRH